MNPHGVVSEVLVAEQNAIVIEAGGEDADAALERVVDGYAHCRGMPPVSVAILERCCHDQHRS